MQLRATRLTAIASAVKRAIKAFSARDLFASGAPGVWYDPSDMSTLFQDSAGTTPVTAVEQPVGLMLDKSKGLVLGSELIPSYDFTTWTTAGTVSSVTATAFTSTGGAGVFKALSLTTGNFYRVRITGSTTVIGGVTVRNTGDAIGSYTITTSTFDVTMNIGWGSQANIYIKNEATGTTTITSISVKELPGNHAFQATSASRPVLSARYNLWTNTETLATQNRTVRAAKHIISFSGTGTVILSGAFIGTLVGTGANNRVYLEFTTTAGTLTATVSGSVTKAQLEEV